MNNKIINIENHFFLRSETNGVTVYDRQKYLYCFYENLSIKQVLEIVIPLNAKNFEKCINMFKSRISLNIQSHKPLNINWLIEDKCNLDCIYCFADDKFNLKKNSQLSETAKHILSLTPLTIGLTGGEPTLNPYLPQILTQLCGKTAITLDTNGTTEVLIDLIPSLKKANALVRITLDTVDNDLLNKLRPPKFRTTSYYNQVALLTKNIKALVDSKINVMVHTVLTRGNINKTSAIAETLIKLKIKRWHLYGVSYCKKCDNYYDKIKVSHDEIIQNQKMLLENYGNQIIITHSIDEDFNANSVVLIDSNGNFFVDTIINGIQYIGENPKAPTLDDISHFLNYKRHSEGYLSN